MHDHGNPMICDVIEIGAGSYWCKSCGRVFRHAALPIRVRCKIAPREPSKTPTIAPAAIGCVHMGQLLRVVPCGLCGARDEPREVYACAVHGEATKRRAKGIACCVGCRGWKQAD